MGDMDSGNSGSMQSSSTGGGGDDQEYESRGESSFPSFFNPPNFPVNPFDNARLLQLYSLNNGSSSGSIFDHHHQQQQQQQQQRQVFDALETANFMAQNNSTSNNSHMEMVWANKFGSLRSTQSDEATCTPTTTAAAPGYNSSNPMNTPQVQLGGHVPSLHNLQGTATGVPSAENSPRSSTPNPNPNPNQNQNVNLGGVGTGGSGGGPGRNPKKRSRASRRAPTTVLTTDTSNFRQMVQEFTGIPAPPFSAPGFSTRTRLDLFGGMGMGMGMGMSMGLGTGMGILPRTAGGGGGSTSLDPPSYLLRPFAQKVLPHPNPSPLHLQQQQRSTATGASTSALAEATVGASSTSATGSSAGNTVISSSTGGAANGATIPATFNLSPQNVLQSPNPMFAFQSLLQPSSNPHASDKYPLSLIQQDAGTDNLGSKGAGAGSSGTAARAPGSTPGGEGEPQSWTGLHQGLGLSQGGHDRHHLTPHRTGGVSVAEGVGNLISGGTDTSNSQRGAPINGTSDNHGGVVRGERGMVDSWICSSD